MMFAHIGGLGAAVFDNADQAHELALKLNLDDPEWRYVTHEVPDWLGR